MAEFRFFYCTHLSSGSAAAARRFIVCLVIRLELLAHALLQIYEQFAFDCLSMKETTCVCMCVHWTVRQRW